MFNHTRFRYTNQVFPGLNITGFAVFMDAAKAYLWNGIKHEQPSFFVHFTPRIFVRDPFGNEINVRWCTLHSHTQHTNKHVHLDAIPCHIIPNTSHRPPWFEPTRVSVPCTCPCSSLAAGQRQS